MPILEAAVLVLTVGVWWLGIRKIELSSAAKSVLSVLDLAVLVASVVALGGLGLILVGAANVVGLLLYSVHLAMRQETILVQVANRTGSSKEEVERLQLKLGRHERLSWAGAIERAEWIREIANRGRSLEEIEQIAPVIGGLSLIYDRPDPAWLISRFDQILRLYGEPASRAESVAETIHASVNASAATFPEMMEAFVTVALPPGFEHEEQRLAPAPG